MSELPVAKHGLAIKAIFPVLGFLAVCFFIFSSIDLAQLKSALASADTKWISLAALITLLQPLLTSLRLRTYLLAGGQSKPYTRCLKAVLAALSLNAVLPARGGDLVKVTFLQDQEQELAPLVGLSLLERLLDILVLCLLALGSSFYVGNLTVFWIAAGALCLPVGALVFLGKAHKMPLIGNKLVRLNSACRVAWKKPGLLFAGCLLAIGCWTIILGIMYCLLRSVGAPVEFPTIAAVTPLAIFVGLLPISISGMGTRDAALVQLLPVVAQETVYAGAFLYTAVAYWFLALIGLAILGKETLCFTMAKTRENQSELKNSKQDSRT